jgi:alpha-galactosidase
MKLQKSALPALIWLLPFLNSTALLAAEQISVSSLDLSHVVQGWGKPQADKSVTGKPLSIGGKSFVTGLGTHADGVIRIQLDGGAERFTSWVGVDDAAANKAASIIFKVVADQKTLFKTPVMRLGDPPRKIDLIISGVRTLLLISDSAGDGTAYDHADWAEAVLVINGAHPSIVGPPREEAIVLTPAPPPQPRINGARIFGVRPGHPFLFTIPATGVRPMKYSVKSLPKGLTVDLENGQITGRIDAPGQYTVTFVAANRLGKTRRKFRIVCGDTLALTPHMGWNSWYVWENHVTEKIMREAADAMVSSGLINHGYQYVNIDDCWAVRRDSKNPTLQGEPRDAQGRINSNPRFPDMRALTGYIHSKGLKAGIYTSPGPRTCALHEGAYQHEELDAARFADWGFDFLKYDWCSYGEIATNADRATLQKPYRLMAEILKRQNRDIVFNLCQYGMGNVWEWGKEVGGNSWRTAGDLGITFEGIASGLFRDGFDVYTRNQLYRFGGPGGWNDPDYLLLGYLSNWKGQTAPTPLTPNEQYTQMSLWCLQSAPLILSGDITRLDPFTLGLLSNDEVIDVDQDPLGEPGRQVAAGDDLEVWAKNLEDGSKAVGLFNRSECESTVSVRWADLGIHGRRFVRDLWRQENLGKFDSQFSATVPRHGVVLVRVAK